jgi:hypothetical protein
MIYAVVAYVLAGVLWLAYFASLRSRVARARKHHEAAER